MHIEDKIKSDNKMQVSILLTSERERELSNTIKNSCDPKEVASAVNEFVNANLRLVISEANSYFKRCGSYIKEYGFDIDDLKSAGHIGLMKAIYKYDPSFNTKFSTYAIPWIRQPIRQLIKKIGPVNVPSYIMNDAIKRKKIEEENENVTDKEMMEKLQVTEKGLANVKMARHTRVSLDSPVSSEDDSISLIDTICDQNATDPSTGVDSEDVYSLLYSAINELDEMRKDIILSQCISNEKIKLSDLGKKWGVTGERIRQIKNETINKLRLILCQKGLKKLNVNA